MAGRSARAAVALIALVALAGLCAVAAGPAAGGDSATVLEVEPENASVPPGETVHVAVSMSSDGGYGPVGVERVAVSVAYDESVLTAEEIHRGPWMEQGNETEIVTETEIDDEAGVARIEQVRDPPAGGATGTDRLAVVTFVAAEDADGAASAVELADAEVGLTSDWPQEAFLHDGTVSVDADAEVVGAEPPAGDGDEGDDPLPGVGLVGAAAAALVALFVARVRDRR